MKTGTQPKLTTVTERAVIPNTNKDAEQMASLSVASAHASAYNVRKLKGSMDQYKENMTQIKETLRKEQGESRKVKRKHEATLSNLEKLHHDYHILEP